MPVSAAKGCSSGTTVRTVAHVQQQREQDNGLADLFTTISTARNPTWAFLCSAKYLDFHVSVGRFLLITFTRCERAVDLIGPNI